MWLKVQYDSGQVKLTWGGEAGVFCAYSVGSETLEQVATELRARLHELSTWTVGSDARDLPTILRALAEEGARLKYALFDSCDRGVIEDLTAWIQDKYAAGDTFLSVTADPALHVPWGLVFDDDPEKLPSNAIAPAAYNAFWSIRYKLATVLSGYRQLDAKLQRQRDNFRILSVVNREVYSKVESDLGSEISDLNSILSYPVGTAFTLEACDQLLSQAAANDTLFHFLGHGDGGMLDLGRDQKKIDAIKLKMMIDRLTRRVAGRQPSCSLLFLNACESATGHADYSLRTAAARPGMCGFIGAETYIPRAFAVRFGARFIRLLMDGSSIGEAIDTLRTDPEMWPLSLTYGCYAYRDFRISTAVV